MAILSIFAENSSEQNITEVLALNEEHFVFDSEITFLHIEYILFLHQKSEEINLLLHGEVEKQEEDYYTKYIKTNPFYKKYLISNFESEFIESGEIIFFSKTFVCPNAYETNWQYEPPQKKIEVDDDCNRSIKAGINKFKIYGVYCTAPELSVKNIKTGYGYSLLKIKKRNNEEFSEGIPIGFRLGMWLKSPKAEGKHPSFIDAVRLRFKYDIHYYCIDEEIDPKEKRFDFFGIKEKIKYSRLWTGINFNNGLNPIIDVFKSEPASKNKSYCFSEISDLLNVPHSDIWVLLPDNWDVVETDILRKVRRPPYILYTTRRTPRILHQEKLPFFEYHKKLCEMINPQYLFTSCDNDKSKLTKFSIKRITKFWKPLLRHLIVYLNLPIFIVVLYLIHFKGDIPISASTQVWQNTVGVFLFALLTDLVLSHKKFLTRLLLIIRNSKGVKLLYKFNENNPYISKFFNCVTIYADIGYILASIALVVFVKAPGTIKILTFFTGAVFCLVGIKKIFSDISTLKTQKY